MAAGSRLASACHDCLVNLQSHIFFCFYFLLFLFRGLKNLTGQGSTPLASDNHRLGTPVRSGDTGRQQATATATVAAQLVSRQNDPHTKTT